MCSSVISVISVDRSSTIASSKKKEERCILLLSPTMGEKRREQKICICV